MKKEAGVVSGGKRTCRVLYKYNPDQEDELALNVNDMIEYTGEVEDGWWKGSLNGKSGVFPSNFVEVIQQKEAQQVADKNKINKEFHNLNPGLSELRTSKPNIDIEVKEPHRIPKLPPKPVKEQCIVQYPYQAQNDDELTLMEGQIVNIMSKDSEDKGWWRGECDGKVGVFPDNFVKMVKVVVSSHHPHQEINSGKQKIRALSPLRDTGTFEKGSREKLCARHQQHIEPPKSPNKKGSFGKSNPPPKPKAPCPSKLSSNKPAAVSSAVNIGQPSSRGSFLGAFKPSLSKSSGSNRSSFSSYKSAGGGVTMSSSPENAQDPLSKSLPNDVDDFHSTEEGDPNRNNFDGVSRREKLAHPTADRVKGPKRRPPSSIFNKDVIALEDQNDDEDINSDSSAIEKNNSSSSVKELPVDPESEPVEDEEDSSMAAPGPSLPNSKSSSPVSAFKEELQNRLENNQNEETSKEVKKPDWLEELSRKQANRKSGFFSDSKPLPTRPPAPDKPQLPTKPSQIRDDFRKLNKRVSEASDKENSRPNRPSSLNDDPSDPPSYSSVVPAEAKNPWITDELPGPKPQPKKHSTCSERSRSKSQDISSERVESSLDQRVSKLESTLILYAERLGALEESLKEERELRLRLQGELEDLRTQQ